MTFLAKDSNDVAGTADDGAGINGVRFTADDVPGIYSLTSYDAASNRRQELSYTSPGPDGNWFTADDVKSIETLYLTSLSQQVT